LSNVGKRGRKEPIRSYVKEEEIFLGEFLSLWEQMKVVLIVIDELLGALGFKDACVDPLLSPIHIENSSQRTFA